MISYPRDKRPEPPIRDKGVINSFNALKELVSISEKYYQSGQVKLSMKILKIIHEFLCEIDFDSEDKYSEYM